jgi:hypothetical protein
VALRGALAGVASALVWQGCDPALKRVFGTPYADAELIGPFLTRGPRQPLANLVAHAGAGAAFGFIFERYGGRGVRRGVAAAVVENTLLWPGMLVLDRIHPARRDGTWPPLFANARVFAQSTAGHALFGAVLGALVRTDRSASYTESSAGSPRHLE